MSSKVRLSTSIVQQKQNTLLEATSLKNQRQWNETEYVET